MSGSTQMGGYYGGGQMGQITPTGCMTPTSHGHTPIHFSSMGHTPYGHTPMHSHPGSGYATPHGPQDLSGIVTPDLDLPLDFSGLDDLPGTDGLQGFTAHTPSAPTPHTHHYTPQQQPPQSQHHTVTQQQAQGSLNLYCWFTRRMIVLFLCFVSFLS